MKEQWVDAVNKKFISLVYFGFLVVLSGNVSAVTVTIDSPINNTAYATNSVDLNYTVTDALSSIDWVGYSLDGQANVTTRGEITTFSNSAGVDLGTWENITFTGAGSDTSVYLRIPKNSTVINASMNVSGFNVFPKCYQETSTTDTACGGLDSGSYDFQTSEFYINYTIPIGAITAKWEVKAGIEGRQNASIPTSCFNDPIQLKIFTYFAAWDDLTGKCFDGDSWVLILTAGTKGSGIRTPSGGTSDLNDGDWNTKTTYFENWNYYNSASDYHNIYEEAIWWNDDVVSSSISNLSIDIANDSVIDWSMTGELNSTNSPQSVDLNITAIQNYADTHNADANGFVLVPLNISSDTAGIVQLDALSFIYHSNATLTSLSDGVHNITVYANDTAGNMNSSTVWFSMDLPPAYSNLTPGNNSYTNDTSQNISIVITDEGDGVNETSLYMNVSGSYYDLGSAKLTYNSTSGLLSYYSDPGEFTMEQSVNVVVHAEDSTGNQIDVAWKFTVTDPFSCIPEMVSYWTFDEGIGTTVIDSIDANLGTLVNGTAWTTAGRSNGALEFDGVDDYVDFGNSSNLNFGEDNFTIELWMKTASSDAMILSKYDFENDVGYILEVFTSNPVPGLIYFGAFDGSVYPDASGTTSLNDSEWHFIAGVREDNLVKVYVDSVLVDSGTDGTLTSIDTLYPLLLGYSSGQSWWGEFFDGTIDEVAIYNRTLTDEEIQQHYEFSLSNSSYCRVPDIIPPAYSDIIPQNNSYTTDTSQDISIVITDEGDGVNENTLSMNVSGSYYDLGSAKLTYNSSSGLLTYYSDPGEFTEGQVVNVVAHAEDNAENRRDIAWKSTVADTIYSIPLIPGWNMVSIPLEMYNWSIPSVLASIEGNYTDIYAYVNGMWYWDTSLLPFFKLTDMAIDQGYWINVSSSDTLELGGTVPSSTSISINPGWNLVSYPSFKTRGINNVLRPISYTDVYTYKNGMWYWDTSLLPPFVLTDMTVDQGYWINATAAGSYDVRK